MSDGMLAQARARSSEVQWRKGPAEHLPFEDGTLDAVVTTSAFHFFDQPAALREFHRVLAPGGLAAVATLSPRQHPLHRLCANRLNPAHNPSPEEMRALFEDAWPSGQRSTPRPPPGVDAGAFRPDHRRHQAVIAPWYRAERTSLHTVVRREPQAAAAKIRAAR
jgi:SAM-dependent methyltransferase